MVEEFEPLKYEELPDAVKAVVKEDTPLPVKMVMADGIMPLPTRELVIALYYLVGDEDKEVSERAKKSLLGMPNDLKIAAIDAGLPPKILNFLARMIVEPKILERIALNANTPDATLEYLAANSNNSVILEIIASNQKRWLRHPDIARALINNPHTPTIVVSRTKELMKLEGIPLVPPAEGEEIVEVPTSALEEIQRLSQDLREGTKSIEQLKAEVAEYLPDFAKDLIKEDLELTQEERTSLFMKIKGMRPVDQMRLALLGGIEARQLLLRSPIRMVREAVLDNPKITIDEIIKIARNRSIDESIVHKIAKNRDWTKNYRVILELVQNPKTPLQFSLKFLERLLDRDLVSIARSKQVPGIVAATAKSLAAQRQKYK